MQINPAEMSMQVDADKEALLPRLGRDVAVADRRKGDGGPVEGDDVPARSLS